MSSVDRSLLGHLFIEAKATYDASCTDGEFFDIFVARHFLKHYDLDEGDIESGIVDGAKDGGIDAVYFLCDGRLIGEIELSTVRKNPRIDVHIFTNKYQDSFPSGPLNDVRVTLQDLTDFDDEAFSEASENYNTNIVDAFEEFREFYLHVASKFPALKFSVVYATASSQPAKAEITSRLTQIENDLKERFSGADVYTEAADARAVFQRVREPPEEVRSLVVSGGHSINLDRGPSYVALSRLSDYYHFICRGDGGLEERLFDDNVRDFEGDVGVNKEIGLSLLTNSGPDFWWLNNGVSIICDDATLSGNQLRIKNPKIVNGLQTSRMIYNHFSPDATMFDDNRVLLVRIIRAEDENVRAEIIRANNRQTPIAPAQLLSTSAVHKDIELYLRTKGLFYERRKNYWRNQGKSKADIITITDLAQAMMTVVGGRPHTARARPGTLLREQGEIVFSPDYDLRIYEKAIDLVRATDALIGETIPGIGTRDKNNIKYNVVAKVAYVSCGNEFSAVRFLQNELVAPTTRRKIIALTYAIYQAAGADDRAAKSEDFWNKVRAMKV